MADHPERTLRQWFAPNIEKQPLCINFPQVAQNCELKSGLIHSLPTFHGLDSEDPHKHLKKFYVVKSLRLPTRFGKHRGFAFVEFLTKQETKNALQALSNTHLYGHHMVLERVKEGESLEELRARTAAQFVDESIGLQNPTKLSLKRKQLDI